jgi:uncharacterized protein YneF (UPF0154 family)
MKKIKFFRIKIGVVAVIISIAISFSIGFFLSNENKSNEINDNDMSLLYEV